MKKQQRFIAGAVCPKCNSMDSLRLDLEKQSIECVECEYSQTEAQRDEGQTKQQSGVQNKFLPQNVNVNDIIPITQIKKQ